MFFYLTEKNDTFIYDENQHYIVWDCVLSTRELRTLHNMVLIISCIVGYCWSSGIVWYCAGLENQSLWGRRFKSCLDRLTTLILPFPSRIARGFVLIGYNVFNIYKEFLHLGGWNAHPRL